MVAVKKVRRLKIANLITNLVANLITNLVASLITSLVAGLVAGLVAIHPINQSELMHLVHVHDPMHNSVFVQVFSCYLHNCYIFLLVISGLLLYYVSVT